MTTLSIPELTERAEQLRKAEAHLLENGQWDAAVDLVDKMDRVEAQLERAQTVLLADEVESMRRNAVNRGDWVEAAQLQARRGQLDREANNRRKVVVSNKKTDNGGARWVEEKTVWVVK